MKHEMRNLVNFEAHATLAEAIWAYLENRWQSPAKGYVTKLAEFQAFSKNIFELLLLWTATLFERDVLCLEHDWLMAGR